MKAILALFLALSCIASIQCTYTPQRSSCGGSLKVSDFYFDNTPVAGIINVAHVCIQGTEGSAFTIEKIGIFSETYQEVLSVEPTVVTEVPACWDIRLPIPQTALSFVTVRFNFESGLGETGACTIAFLETTKNSGLSYVLRNNIKK